MPELALVQKIEAFEPVSDQEKERLRSLCSETISVSRRRDIISEGDRPTHVNVILEGWAARYALNKNGGRRITAFLLPGDFCDIHITSLAAMDHGIVAITDCRVGLIRKEEIDLITHLTPKLTLAFWRSTLVDEAILRQWLVNASRRSANQRVAHLLCEIHARLQLIGHADGDQFTMPLTQEEIADATGLTNIHVNRMLRELREADLVGIEGNYLSIPNVGKLRRHADFDPSYLHLSPSR